MSTLPTAANALAVVLCIMLGLLVGLSAGIITWFTKKSLPAATLAAGSAFGGTVALGLLVKSALGY
jgi:hypothetical protein